MSDSMAWGYYLSLAVANPIIAAVLALSLAIAIAAAVRRARESKKKLDAAIAASEDGGSDV